MINNSRAYESIIRFLINFKKNKEEYAVTNLSKKKLSPELEEAWKLTLNEISEIVKIAEKEKIPYLFFVPPYKYQLENPENTNQPQILLKNFAKDNNLLFLDLLDLFYLNKQIYNSSLFDDASLI